MLLLSMLVQQILDTQVLGGVVLYLFTHPPRRLGQRNNAPNTSSNNFYRRKPHRASLELCDTTPNENIAPLILFLAWHVDLLALLHNMLCRGMKCFMIVDMVSIFKKCDRLDMIFNFNCNTVKVKTRSRSKVSDRR